MAWIKVTVEHMRYAVGAIKDTYDRALRRFFKSIEQLQTAFLPNVKRLLPECFLIDNALIERPRVFG